jgi:hypothetical protein
LIKLKEQELAQRAQADQARIQAEQQKIGLQTQEMQQKMVTDAARLETQEAIADQKADLTLMRLKQMEQQNAIKARTQPQGRQ